MRKRIRLTITIIVIIIVVSVSIWRLIPRTFSDVILEDKKAVTSCSSSVTIQGLKDGRIYSDTYILDNIESQDKELDELFEILETSKYKQNIARSHQAQN